MISKTPKTEDTTFLHGAVEIMEGLHRVPFSPKKILFLLWILIFDTEFYVLQRGILVFILSLQWRRQAGAKEAKSY